MKKLIYLLALSFIVFVSCSDDVVNFMDYEEIYGNWTCISSDNEKESYEYVNYRFYKGSDTKYFVMADSMMYVSGKRSVIQGRLKGEFRIDGNSIIITESETNIELRKKVVDVIDGNIVIDEGGRRLTYHRYTP